MAKKQREKSKKRLFTVIAAVVVIALAAAALLYIPAYRREHEIKSAYPDVTYDSRKFAETDWNRDVSADEDYMGLDKRSRLNKPSTVGTNWKWRLAESDLTEGLKQEIRSMTLRYGRMNWS